ncbi:MAG: hypothetical protein ICV87_00370 [Gemmatimonadetes bacterium]|nr:hypothetical protein [Gemmatimonadota bacterium]
MSKLLDRAARLTLALLVAGGLGIGAQAAFAGTQSASACANDPNNGRIPVSCTNNAVCDSPCKYYFGPESGGGCLGGCCVCAL